MASVSLGVRGRLPKGLSFPSTRIVGGAPACRWISEARAWTMALSISKRLCLPSKEASLTGTPPGCQ
jgi:hypothetical protein